MGQKAIAPAQTCHRCPLSQWLSPAGTALRVTLGTGLSRCPLPTSPPARPNVLTTSGDEAARPPVPPSPMGTELCHQYRVLGQPPKKCCSLLASWTSPSPPHPRCHQPGGDILQRDAIAEGHPTPHRQSPVLSLPSLSLL